MSNLEKSGITADKIESIVRECLNRAQAEKGSQAPGNNLRRCDLPNARALKQQLESGKPAYGMWISLESPTITEIAARLGFDWVVIDAEHGHLDLKNVMEHVRVANLMNMTCLVRVSDIQMGLLKRVMDIGADGVLIPQVRTPEEVAEAVRYVKYPPEGVRGVGAERSTGWAHGVSQCVPNANQQSLVIPLMETVEAAENIDAILDVPGVDGIFFGPHDFSANSGTPGEWKDPRIIGRMMAIQKRVLARGKPCGIIGFSLDDLLAREKEGFTMIGMGFDTGLLIRSAAQALEHVGRKIPEDAWF